MKGVVAVVVTAALLVCVGFVMATPPLPQPLQYEQFCDSQKVSGTGSIDVSTSVNDKKIALDYYNVMSGDGDFELDQTHAYSQKAIDQGNALNDSHNSSLNLLENEKLTYNGKTPLTGGKEIKSDAFWGGLGADVREMYSVNQMEKDQTTFFASTATAPTQHNNLPNTRENLNKILKADGLADQKDGGNRVETDMTEKFDSNGNPALIDPAQIVGMNTKNSFNGTWGVDAKEHEIFWKNIQLHEMFTGTFETEKDIKFHDNPVPENELNPCKDIDC